jgi:hypothetical protein
MKRLLPILLLFNLIGIDLKPLKLPTRNFLEFFAGDQAVTKGLRLRGFVGDPIDVRLNADHDLLTPCGFLVAIVLICSVCKGGLVWLAPPCSTWVWMSRSSTGRHLDPLGNRDNPNVERQNMLVSRLCYLISLCWHRGVFFVIEQPDSTKMMEHPRLRKLLTKIGGCWDSAKMDMGPFSLEAPKGSLFSGHAPHLPLMDRHLTKTERRRITKNDHMLKTHYSKIKNGKKRIYGGSGLKKTQSYPTTFGCYHADLYAKMVPPADPAGEPPRVIDLSDSDSDDSIPNDDPALADLTNYNPEYFSGPAQLANELRVLFRH